MATKPPLCKQTHQLNDPTQQQELIAQQIFTCLNTSSGTLPANCLWDFAMWPNHLALNSQSWFDAFSVTSLTATGIISISLANSAAVLLPWNERRSALQDCKTNSRSVKVNGWNLSWEKGQKTDTLQWGLPRLIDSSNSPPAARAVELLHRWSWQIHSYRQILRPT